MKKRTTISASERDSVTMSFMRSKTRKKTPAPKKRSLIEMTREEFKERLKKNKRKVDELVH